MKAGKVDGRVKLAKCELFARNLRDLYIEIEDTSRAILSQETELDTVRRRIRDLEDETIELINRSGLGVSDAQSVAAALLAALAQGQPVTRALAIAVDVISFVDSQIESLRNWACIREVSAEIERERIREDALARQITRDRGLLDDKIAIRRQDEKEFENLDCPPEFGYRTRTY